MKKTFTIREYYKLCCLPEQIRKWDIYEKHKEDFDQFIGQVSVLVQKLSDEPEKEVKL